jgi:hypothetical protein
MHLKMREDFYLKPIHAAVYMLDPKYACKNILFGAEINQAYGILTTVSRHLGLDKGMVLGSLAKYSTLPSKGIGMEMQYGSHANISHQPPGGRDFVDLRLFPLLPQSSSKSHQHLLPQHNWSLFGNTHTKACNQLTNTRVEKLVAIRADLRLFEPDNEQSSTRLESDSEDEASESDVQEVDIEEVQGEDMEA